MSEQQLDTFLEENRKFPPSQAFADAAHISQMDEYLATHRESIESPETFWGRVAEECHWFRKWDNVLDSSEAPFFKWFLRGAHQYLLQLY